MRRKPAADPFAQLTAEFGGIGLYSPRIGYLYHDGSVQDYSPQNVWISMRRAISSCFGSCARRTRGMVWSEARDGTGPPVAALLGVVDSRGRFVWKQRIDFPPEMEGSR